jgi:flagellar biosynthesis protein FlhA
MADAAPPNNPSLSRLLRTGIGVPVGVLAVLSMVVLPLPPFALDVLFTFNIALSFRP